MHNYVAMIVILVIVVISLVVGAVFFFQKDPAEPPQESGTTIESSEDTLPIMETTPVSETETTVVIEPPDLLPETEIEPDEGNEVYFDPSVIEALTAMEQKGEEDEVNEILDWLILLINRYARNGYSHEAIGQIQRFYFLYRAEIMQESLDAFCERIEDCIPIEGATEEGFAELVNIAFGWSMERDYAYVFDGGAA